MVYTQLVDAMLQSVGGTVHLRPRRGPREGAERRTGRLHQQMTPELGEGLNGTPSHPASFLLVTHIP